jgi:hypothetical protein
VQQYQNQIEFFNWCPPYPAQSPLTDWHVPGNCYTSSTRTVLDNRLGIAKPGNAQFDVCLSAVPNADGSVCTGAVQVELYALDAFSCVPCANPQQQPSYRQIGVWTANVASNGVVHAGGALTPAQLSMLAVAAGAIGTDGVHPVGGITFGLRLRNDPSCANASTLRVTQYSAVLSFGPAA